MVGGRKEMVERCRFGRGVMGCSGGVVVVVVRFWRERKPCGLWK